MEQGFIGRVWYRGLRGMGHEAGIYGQVRSRGLYVWVKGL